MIKRLLFELTKNMPCELIKIRNKPHLERYFIAKCLGVSFYIHRFVGDDVERYMHNHPWQWGRSFILTGGYSQDVVVDMCHEVEDTGCITKRKKVFVMNKVDHNLFHRIVDVKKNTFTFCIHGPSVTLPNGKPKGWGFLTNGNNVGVPGSVIFCPFDDGHHNWWKNAKKGSEIGRQPL